MPSFDVVSELNEHELTNAVDQANRELQQRFDFKDSGATYELDEFVVKMRAPAEFQLKQMLDVLKMRVAKRGIDASCLDPQDPVTNLAEARQEVVLRHGIDQELGKKIQRLVKDSKLKVQAGIQGDKVRITGKKRDDLQEAIALLRASSLDLPLQFENFRD
ncbi:MAG: YajQ family cyclic di-GMP-binding protein [Steroidobacteraceae bacterium]